MPHKRSSDDLDLVPADPEPSKRSRKKPPAPEPLPAFTPLIIQNPFMEGYSNLPPNLTADSASPYKIFSLFFNEEILIQLQNHTNEYAELQLSKSPKPHRAWKPTTTNELRAYIAIHIWMGVHGQLGVETFWNTDPMKGAIHDQVRNHMSLRRWQQIDRFFHISKPSSTQSESPYEKLQPLSNHLRQLFKQYWSPGAHLAIDETIARFMGHSADTVNIPSKPTPEGYKIWVLADKGYVIDWLYHAKGDKKGPIGLDIHWTKKLGFSKTEAVVLQLASTALQSGFRHAIWLDNLFTSASLLLRLKQMGYGGAGTCRTQKTEREKEEQSHGSKAQRQQHTKEKNRGLNSFLSEIKLIYGPAIEWGELHGRLSNDKEVMQFAWKDQNVVLFMTTLHTGHEQVYAGRRRPAKTSTNAKTSRAAFKDDAVKAMAIPEFIDMYNHYMNGVDQADQLRSYYSTQRIQLRTWKPLWHFLLDTAVVNTYKIANQTCRQSFTKSWDSSSHKKFRIRLATQLFEHSERLSQQQKKSPLRAIYSIEDHQAQKTQLARLGKQQLCHACVQAGRRVMATNRRKKRKPLGQLSKNTVRRSEYRKTIYGCSLCSVPLCKTGLCWEEHIEAAATRSRGQI